jgi:hypothetical protein
VGGAGDEGGSGGAGRRAWELYTTQLAGMPAAATQQSMDALVDACRELFPP